MSKMPRPTVSTPTPDELAPVLAAIGLPRPLRVDPIGKPWVHANYRLRMADIPDVMLRRVVQQPGYDTLENELAALVLARDIPGLPTVQRFQILPHGLVPWSGAVSDLLPGVQGMRIVKARQDLAPAVVRGVGGLMRVLADHPRPTWGLVGDRGVFTPRRATWAEEWRAHVAQWAGFAKAMCTDLGPLSEALEGRIAERIDVLETADRWCLVHGDLHPSNLLFDKPRQGSSEPVLTGVVDWEAASVADPLCEWALPLELPVQTVGRILAGYGSEAFAAILDDGDAVARLEVYYLTRCLHRLGFAAFELFRGEQGRRRCWVMEFARMMTVEALEPSMVFDKLSAALALGCTDRPIQTLRSADAVKRSLFRSVEAPRFAPPLHRVHVAPLMGAIAAALLARDDQRSNRAEWLEIAEAAADLLGPQHDPLPGEPIPDRRAWATRVTQSLVGKRLALAAWWLFLEGVSELANGSPPEWWPINDHVLRGAEGLLTSLNTSGSDERLVGPQRLAAVLMATAAAHRLPGLLDDRGVEALSDTFDQELQETWEDLTVFGGAPDGEVPADPLRAWLARVGSADLTEPDLFFPALTFAIRGLPEDVRPAEAARILAVLGFGLPAAADPV